MELLEVDRLLAVVYDKCLQCLKENDGLLQDHHSKYGIHTAILRALESGAHSFQTRMAVRRAQDTYFKEKQDAYLKSRA